jgi:chain length determinant protein EpsF
MTFNQFLAVLRARRWLILWVTLGVLVPIVVLSLVLPKKYLGTASVVVEVRPDPVTGMGYQSALTPAVVATQIDIITSDRVARRVVRQLKMAEIPQFREQWQQATKGEGDIESWLVELLQNYLDVRPSRDSSVININYKGADPAFAAGLANAFAKAYLDTVLELRVDPAKQYSSFFDARAKEARDALEKAQTKLSDFQRESGVVMTDERMDIENQRLNELSSQLVAIQALSAESGSRQAQAAGGAADKLQEINAHPVVAALRADLSRSEARLQEYSAKLGDKHPQVIELKANINELRERLDSEVKRLSAGVGVTNSITRQREAQVRSELEAQRAKVLKMKQVRDEGMLILRDVEAAQRAYDQIQQRLTQTSLESQVTSSNISLLTAATPPVAHISPRPLLNSVLGLFLGGLLGVGAALVVELRDRRIRSERDVPELLGLPLLGVLPDADGKPTKRQRRQQQRLMSSNTPKLGKSA